MSKKHKKELKGASIVFVITFIIIAGLFCFFAYRAKQNAAQTFTMELTNGGDGSMEGVTVFFETSQDWVSVDADGSKIVGAQYDGVIFNEMSEDIRDWKLTIRLPEEGWIDSSWNGVYEETPGQILLTPMDYNAIVESGGSQTFGFIMYADTILDLQSFILTGYREVHFQESDAFRYLIGAAIIWAASLLVYLTVVLRIRRLEIRRENDRQIISQALHTFAKLIDAKDPYTKGHSIRVAAYSREIAKRMKMDKDEVDNVGYIGLMHDCGKMGIPDEVLNKPGKLTAEERKIIESHTLLGGDVLEKFNAIEGIRDGALYHHERYDGHGYPKGLRESEIPLYARIICVADSYDAMSSDRCYRKHLSEEVILEELDINAGKQFDPQIVRYMIEMIQDGFIKSLKFEEY